MSRRFAAGIWLVCVIKRTGDVGMKNYRMLIEYDGTRYYGWQRQPGQNTIQGKLEAVLSLLCGTETEVIGAGRTDGGVHARGMVANAVFETALSPEEIRSYLNRYLPDDIAVLEVREASPRFHARYNAIGCGRRRRS